MDRWGYCLLRVYGMVRSRSIKDTLLAEQEGDSLKKSTFEGQSEAYQAVAREIEELMERLVLREGC